MCTFVCFFSIKIYTFNKFIYYLKFYKKDFHLTTKNCMSAHINFCISFGFVVIINKNEKLENNYKHNVTMKK